MSGGLLLTLAGLFFGLVAIGAMVVVNVSCEGDFQCDRIAGDAWLAMYAFGALSVLFLLLAAAWAVTRRLS